MLEAIISVVVSTITSLVVSIKYSKKLANYLSKKVDGYGNTIEKDIKEELDKTRELIRNTYCDK